MNSVDDYDYEQSFGDSYGLDFPDASASDQPFYTKASPQSTGTAQVVANNNSSFWSGLGSFASNLGGAVTNALPSVVANLTTPSTPNPNAVGQTQQTTAQKLAAQSGGMMPWIIGGAVALIAVIGGFLMLRKRK